ncbi:hypothetical protein BELL_0252g00030 [Botrytis elliptica]|uniref:Uncharacterized protein n=1 Tax=Botrytis elliptica TaxID=278938 RepID=A0A4Z1JTD9_9HELO|nr:hypothetical protein BELL_0252g00030 [Botrytis elliptica]
MTRRLDLMFVEEWLYRSPTTDVSYANNVTYDMKMGMGYKLSLSHYGDDPIHCTESEGLTSVLWQRAHFLHDDADNVGFKDIS